MTGKSTCEMLLKLSYYNYYREKFDYKNFSPNLLIKKINIYNKMENNVLKICDFNNKCKNFIQIKDIDKYYVDSEENKKKKFEEVLFF